MSKIIINNKTDLLDDTEVLRLVIDIIKSGRVSNDGKQYCYLTSYKHDKNEYHIVTDLNKNSDTFTCYEVTK